MKIQPTWLDLIDADAERELISEAFVSDLGSGILATKEVPLGFTLSPASNRWVSGIANLYGTSAEDVLERCIQLAKFIGDICPWAHRPGVHYVEAILNSSRLRSRAASCREKCQILAAQQAFFLRLPQPPQTAGLAPSESAQISRSLAGEAQNLEAPSDRMSEAFRLLLMEDSRRGLVEDSKTGAECHQPVAGELVYHLYWTAIRRDEHPEILLRHFVAAARYLDANFPDLKVPSLVEQLLLKALQARKVALELNRILSALETSLVDLAEVQDRFADLSAHIATRGHPKS